MNILRFYNHVGITNRLYSHCVSRREELFTNLKADKVDSRCCLGMDHKGVLKRGIGEEYPCEFNTRTRPWVAPNISK